MRSVPRKRTLPSSVFGVASAITDCDMGMQNASVTANRSHAYSPAILTRPCPHLELLLP